MRTALNQLLANTPKGLLLDLDGTLVDSAADITAAVDTLLHDAGLPLAGQGRVRQWLGNGAKVLVERALAFAYGVNRDRLDSEDFNIHYQHFLKLYRDSNGRYSRLFDGVLEALTRWHQEGVKLAIVTNKPIEFVRPLLERFELNEFFSVVVGGDTLALQKPDPAPLLIACKDLLLLPCDCVMIGDSRDDVEAAKAAKMPVICVSYGYNHGEAITVAKPDYVVDSLLELILL